MIMVSKVFQEPKIVHTGKNPAFAPRDVKIKTKMLIFSIFQGTVSATKNKIHINIKIYKN